VVTRAIIAASRRTNVAVNAEAWAPSTIRSVLSEAPDQAITFNRFWYPGWNAYLLDAKNGRPIQRMEVLREEGPLARVVVPVSSGQASSCSASRIPHCAPARKRSPSAHWHCCALARAVCAAPTNHRKNT